MTGDPSPATFSPGERNGWLLAEDAELLADCDRATHRVGGPGGQHRNKTESAIRLVHRPTRVEVVATERRSQHDNQRVALERMREALAAEVRATVENIPPEWTSGIGRDGRVQLPKRQWVRLVRLATALDMFSIEAGNLSAAAKRLGVTSSQLVRVLADERAVWQAAQRIRQRHGLGTLQLPHA